MAVPRNTPAWTGELPEEMSGEPWIQQHGDATEQHHAGHRERGFRVPRANDRRDRNDRRAAANGSANGQQDPEPLGTPETRAITVPANQRGSQTASATGKAVAAMADAPARVSRSPTSAIPVRSKRCMAQCRPSLRPCRHAAAYFARACRAARHTEPDSGAASAARQRPGRRSRPELLGQNGQHDGNGNAWGNLTYGNPAGDSARSRPRTARGNLLAAHCCDSLPTRCRGEPACRLRHHRSVQLSDRAGCRS